jgi:hypothetical protein
MVYKMIVAATNANGDPDFYFCKVDCTEQDAQLGLHYEAAKNAAKDNGYEGEMFAFDGDDPPKPLFNLFNWDSVCPLSLRK